ncbi:MAG: excinuclease ABC subunit UvrC [Gammaproteobacteria bacterium]|nr:excinuclease ABC subunit UvrC [Gammaproteobacteria bacterium]
MDDTEPSLESSDEPSGFDAKEFLKNLTSSPGVYRMLNEAGKVIYVGKARNLKKRVSSYFNRGDQTPKTRAMVARIRGVEVTLTHTENEALILENNLIKTLKPQYNVLFRDDKSYPYIFLSTSQQFPRLAYYRGARKEKGRYFGPYPSAGAVRESLNLLQKLFPVRQCEDSYFRNRSRPCLQYQIKRCTAPCVGYIDAEKYAEDVRHAMLFLEGKNSQVIDELAGKMDQAAEVMEFEKAAVFRDQIAALRKVQERQYITGEKGDLDVIAAVTKGALGCVQVFFIRQGQNLGNKTFFPSHSEQVSVEEMLEAFISQYYIGKSGARTVPAEILVNVLPQESEVLAQVLSEQSGRKVQISDRCRGERARWLKIAQTNADAALQVHMADKANVHARFEALADALKLEQVPQRIECFDISHTMGEATVASCVVADHSGMLKSDYRRFNIDGITGGDDYAAMHQALSRRFRRLVEGEGKQPDIVLIDGGKGQLAQAEAVLAELQLHDILLIGVAKGVERKPGMETLFLSGVEQPFILPADSLALHLIQQIRDEAHRFAIQGHRAKRGKARGRSALEDIEGLGPKRRQQLLRQFGGLQGIQSAGIEDLAAVKGISAALAEKIYQHFHSD